jgi:hypothetical protein
MDRHSNSESDPREDRDVLGEDEVGDMASKVGADMDADADTDADDDGEVSEERQRHAEQRVRAHAEIQRAYRAGDWRAAAWRLARGDDGLLGPYCRACSAALLPDLVGTIRTPSARAAAKFLDDDDRKSWGSRCVGCGKVVSPRGEAKRERAL